MTTVQTFNYPGSLGQVGHH